MAIDDDQLSIKVRQLVQDEPSDAETIADAAINALVSTAVPGVGSLIANLLSETAHKRWRVRVHELLSDFATRVALLDSQIEDRSFYASEEFQALLLEAIEQEKTNRFDMKRKMLAQGLAHSGTRAFIADQSKETFFRILRDLSPTDLQALQSLLPHKQGKLLRTPTRSFPHTQDAAVFNRLQGFGLVGSLLQLKPKRSFSKQLNSLTDVANNMNLIISSEPSSVFAISHFGKNFLDFLISTEPAD